MRIVYQTRRKPVTFTDRRVRASARRLSAAAFLQIAFG
jgi:hypothetical protein